METHAPLYGHIALVLIPPINPILVGENLPTAKNLVLFGRLPLRTKWLQWFTFISIVNYQSLAFL